MKARSHGRLFEEVSDVQRWKWWGEAARRGNSDCFCRKFPEEVKEAASDSSRAAVVFAIGRSLKGNVNEDDRRIFGSEFRFTLCICPARIAIAFFDSQVAAARRAVDTWTLIGLRLNVVKDIRVVIGKRWYGILQVKRSTNEEFLD